MPQPCNAIGYARGVHSVGGFQTANGNIPIEHRFCEKYLHLPVLARKSTIKTHGMVRVLCGVDKTGKKHNEPCFADDVAALYDGVSCEIPDDRNGGVRKIKLRWFFIVLCADMLGAHALLPYMETPGANHCCSGCDWDKSHPDAHTPFSFIHANKKKRKRWQLRDWTSEKAEIERIRKLPQTKASNEMSKSGCHVELVPAPHSFNQHLLQPLSQRAFYFGFTGMGSTSCIAQPNT